MFLGIIRLEGRTAVPLPHCRSRDDTDEEDSTPAQRVACRKNENVLEEECVQLC